MDAVLYGRSAVRIARRARRLGAEERLVFVVGSPRSGTTFTGSALGSLPGFVDLDEVQPWKAAIPGLVGTSPDEAGAHLRRILERVRRLGLARGLRGVEQTPETSFVLAAALHAYPEALAVHVIRDGRDVATSLLERGWLSAERSGADDAGLAYGPHARFWVEPGREEAFASASDATRAAWAWRRYVTAADAVPGRTVRVRYEQLVADPKGAAGPGCRSARRRRGPGRGCLREGARPLGGPLAARSRARAARGRRARGRSRTRHPRLHAFRLSPPPLGRCFAGPGSG